MPGYGEVWQPNNVGYNWDPFSNGYWSYSPGFGYTWVSSYPWGWMPYRYGRWVFVNGRGWCWAPGGWSRWYSRPRLVNAPPGFHAPVPPADRRIVDRDPDRNHHEPPPVIGGPVRRSVGPVGGRVGTMAMSMLSAVRVETEATSAFTPTMMWRECRGLTIRHRSQSLTLNNDRGRVDNDRNPKVVDQQPARGTGDRGGDFNRSRDNHQPTPEPVRRSNNEGTPPPTQTERQHNPPPQTFTPAPQRPTEHNMYTPPPRLRRASAASATTAAGRASISAAACACRTSVGAAARKPCEIVG